MNKLIAMKGVEIIKKLLNKKMILSLIALTLVLILGMSPSVSAEEGAGGNTAGIEFYVEKTNPPTPEPKPTPNPKPKPKPFDILPQTGSTYSLTVVLIGGILVVGVGIVMYRRKARGG